MPLSETITGFFDKLKECTSGYASFEYEQSGYQKTDLVKVKKLKHDLVPFCSAQKKKGRHFVEWNACRSSRFACTQIKCSWLRIAFGSGNFPVYFNFFLFWTFRSPRNWGMWFIANCLKWSFRLLAETRFCAEREFLPCERWVQKCVLCHSGLESPGCACQAVWRRCDSQDEAFGQAKEREKANAKHWKRWVGPRSVFCRFEELREGFL